MPVDDEKCNIGIIIIETLKVPWLMVNKIPILIQQRVGKNKSQYRDICHFPCQ